MQSLNNYFFINPLSYRIFIYYIYLKSYFIELVVFKQITFDLRLINWFNVLIIYDMIFKKNKTKLNTFNLYGE